MMNVKLFVSMCVLSFGLYTVSYAMHDLHIKDIVRDDVEHVLRQPNQLIPIDQHIYSQLRNYMYYFFNNFFISHDSRLWGTEVLVGFADSVWVSYDEDYLNILGMDDAQFYRACLEAEIWFLQIVQTVLSNNFFMGQEFLEALDRYDADLCAAVDPGWYAPGGEEKEPEPSMRGQRTPLHSQNRSDRSPLVLNAEEGGEFQQPLP